jgi:hypothetical protein
VNRILASAAAGPRSRTRAGAPAPRRCRSGWYGRAGSRYAPGAGSRRRRPARHGRRGISPPRFDRLRQAGCGLPAAEPPSMGPPLDRLGGGGRRRHLAPWRIRSFSEGVTALLVKGYSAELTPPRIGNKKALNPLAGSKGRRVNRLWLRLARWRIGWGPSGFKTAKGSGRARSTAPASRSRRRRSAR